MATLFLICVTSKYSNKESKNVLMVTDWFSYAWRILFSWEAERRIKCQVQVSCLEFPSFLSENLKSKMFCGLIIWVYLPVSNLSDMSAVFNFEAKVEKFYMFSF